MKVPLILTLGLLFFPFYLDVLKVINILSLFLFNKNVPWSGNSNYCYGQEVNKGTAGEFYYVPQGRKVRPTLPGPKKIITLPIYPRTQVLLPNTEERFSVPELKYRRMFNELETNAGLFGFSYYIPSFNTGKLGLAGTIAKIKKIERIEDGSMFVTVEGLARYWMDELFTDTPYYKGKVRLISDITQEHGDKYGINYPTLNQLALSILQDLRLAINYTSILYPDKPLLLNEKFLKCLPPVYYTEANKQYQCPAFLPYSESREKDKLQPHIRTVNIPDYHVNAFLAQAGAEVGGRIGAFGFPKFDPYQRKKEYYETEIEKLSQFSFVVLSLLKVDLPTKLKCLQTFHIEKRLLKIRQILRNTNSYSEGEILRKNLLTTDQVVALRQEILQDYLNFQILVDLSISKSLKLQKWAPENYIDGEWKMRPALME